MACADAGERVQVADPPKEDRLDEQYVARRSVRDLPATIASLSDRLSELTADEATATAHADDVTTIGERAWSREGAPAMLARQLDALPKKVHETTRVPLGTYRGLHFGIVQHTQFPPEIYLEGALTRLATPSRDHQAPRAVLNALERLADGYSSKCDRVQRDLGIAQSQLREIPVARIPGAGHSRKRHAGNSC